MASFFSTLSNVTEAISSLADLAFGAAGGVVLGEFSFSGFEVPEYISVPGQQKLIIHNLPGGDRVIDALGDDPGDISWSGTFLDGDPYSRAQELEYMRSVGEPIGLQWGPFFYTVVIRSFESRTYYGRVQYSIACAVLRNEATAQSGVEPDLDNVVGGDIISAIVSAPAELAPILSTAQQAVSVLGKLVPGSPILAVASASLGAAAGGLTALSSTAGSAIASISSIASGGGLISSAASLSSAVSAAGSVAQSIQSAAYVGRALRNLA